MAAKAVIRRLLNWVLSPAGYEIRKTFTSDRDFYPISPRMIEDEIARCVKDLDGVHNFFRRTARSSAEEAVREYFKVYPTCPIRAGFGTSGFNTGLILFSLARLTQPQVIVESGTFQGFSSWIFRMACPSAEIHCFDLSFSELAYRDNSIFYHEHDWSDLPLAFDATDSSLCFFDDHVNQAKRLLEAQERGFKRLIFDDDVSTHALHRDGLPPVPTISMIFDETLREGERLEWISQGDPKHYVHDAVLTARARNTVSKFLKAPDLCEHTGYASTPVSLVELR